MTGGTYDDAWWRQYVTPIAERHILSSAETVLDAIRKDMTADEIRMARTLIDLQWEKLGGKPKERDQGPAEAQALAYGRR